MCAAPQNGVCWEAEVGTKDDTANVLKGQVPLFPEDPQLGRDKLGRFQSHSDLEPGPW